MARALPSAIPPQMYRHFALVTVLLTAGVAMFAEGENREATAAQVERSEPREPRRDETVVAPPPPAPARARRRHDERFARGTGFDGFDRSFGAPTDRALGALATRTTRLASGVTAGVAQAGYSEKYLATLDREERERLLAGLAQEGMLSPAERERRSAALIAASGARSGASAADF